jgi:hypothetical protein
MNEKTLAKLCLAITLFGTLMLLVTYENEFSEKTISEMILEDGTTGIVFGRVTFVMKNSPTTLFTIYAGNEINVYYPRETKLRPNDFVFIYAETQEYNGKIELFAHKVINE